MDLNGSTSKSWVLSVNIMYQIVQWAYQQTKTVIVEDLYFLLF